MRAFTMTASSFLLLLSLLCGVGGYPTKTNHVGQGQHEGHEAGDPQWRGESRRRSEREHGEETHLRSCRVINVTSAEILCDQSAECPDFTDCTHLPEELRIPLFDSLQVHVCVPKVCDVTPCPEGSRCQVLALGRLRRRCVPSFRLRDPAFTEPTPGGASSNADHPNYRHSQHCGDELNTIFKKHR